MKKAIQIFAVLTLTLVTTAVCCAPRTLGKGRPILSQLLYQEDVRAFKLPGFLVRYAMLATEETRKIRPTLKGMTSITISLQEDMKNSGEVFERICSRLNRANYSSYIEVIDNHSRIAIKALEKDGKIKEMVIIIDDNSSFICLGIKGNIYPESFIQLVSNFTEDSKSISI